MKTTYMGTRFPYEAKSLAQKLYNEGYRQVSRKFCILARVDVEDVREFFRTETPCSGVSSLSIESMEEHYRRVHSNDEIKTTEQVMEYIREFESRKHGWQPVEICKEVIPPEMIMGLCIDENEELIM